MTVKYEASDTVSACMEALEPARLALFQLQMAHGLDIPLFVDLRLAGSPPSPLLPEGHILMPMHSHYVVLSSGLKQVTPFSVTCFTAGLGSVYRDWHD